MPISDHIDYKRNAMDDEESWFEDWDKFYPLKNILAYIKDKWVKKEKLHINSMWHKERWSSLNAIDMAEHYLRIQKSDLSYPIIIHYDWLIVDWYHRVAKSIIESKEYIYAYRINILEVEYKENKWT